MEVVLKRRDFKKALSQNDPEMNFFDFREEGSIVETPFMASLIFEHRILFHRNNASAFGFFY